MKKLILFLLLALMYADGARIGVTKNFYINDTQAFRTIQWYEDTGRFVPQGVIGGFATFDVFQIQTDELKYIYNNWTDMRADRMDIWAEVPSAALDNNVPVGFPDRIKYDAEGVAIGIKTWRERSNYIVKHDDPTKAIVSMSPRDSNYNNLASGNTSQNVKDFMDLIIGLTGYTIDNIYSGAGIQGIKATYLPPEE